MRFVTFEIADGTSHTGVVKDDWVIDITRWLSITVGDLAQSIIGQMRESEHRDKTWMSRQRQRSRTFMRLWASSSSAKRTGSYSFSPEYGDEVPLDELHSIQTPLHSIYPFDLLALIKTEPALELARTLVQESEDTLKADNLIIALADVRMLAPIPRPPKHVLCLGRNYAEHAAESRGAFGEAGAGVDKPAFPTVFTKAPTAITGPHSEIPFDANVSTEIDWEGELAFVIGKGGKNIRREDAMDHVFGYTVLNDISARDMQKRYGGQFFKGKSLDGACPIGPWIVTADEIPDPQGLEITTRVNGVVKQHDNTRSMLYTIPEIIEHLSLGMTLEPGDIVATGTPAGVGFARTPPEFLGPGDIVEVEIENVGLIRNRVAD